MHIFFFLFAGCACILLAKLQFFFGTAKYLGRYLKREGDDACDDACDGIAGNGRRAINGAYKAYEANGEGGGYGLRAFFFFLTADIINTNGAAITSSIPIIIIISPTEKGRCPVI